MRSKPWSTIGKKTTVFCFDRFFFFFFLPQSIRKVQYHLGHYLKGGKICFLILVLAEDFTTSVKKKKKKQTKTFHIMRHMLFWYHFCSCLGNLPPILAICPESGACPSVWDPLCYESMVALQSCYWHSASRKRKELWDGKTNDWGLL